MPAADRITARCDNRLGVRRRPGRKHDEPVVLRVDRCGHLVQLRLGDLCAGAEEGGKPLSGIHDRKIRQVRKRTGDATQPVEGRRIGAEQRPQPRLADRKAQIVDAQARVQGDSGCANHPEGVHHDDAGPAIRKEQTDPVARSDPGGDQRTGAKAHLLQKRRMGRFAVAEPQGRAVRPGLGRLDQQGANGEPRFRHVPR